MVRACLMLAFGLAACAPSAPHDSRLARAPLAQRLAAADARAGAGIFNQCAPCHSIAQGSGDRAGPNLYAVVGRPVARGSDRFNYTAALRSLGGVWTAERLDAWLADPQKFAPGTNMPFQGLRDGMDRADVIRFLTENGPTPRSRPAR